MGECISCQAVSAARSQDRTEQMCRLFAAQMERDAARLLSIRLELAQVKTERDELRETVARQNKRLAELAQR